MHGLLKTEKPKGRVPFFLIAFLPTAGGEKIPKYAHIFSKASFLKYLFLHQKHYVPIFVSSNPKGKIRLTCNVSRILFLVGPNATDHCIHGHGVHSTQYSTLWQHASTFSLLLCNCVSVLPISVCVAIQLCENLCVYLYIICTHSITLTSLEWQEIFTTVNLTALMQVGVIFKLQTRDIMNSNEMLFGEIFLK